MKSDYVFRLIRTHVEGDQTAFRATIAMMAAAEKRAGRINVAERLRCVLDGLDRPRPAVRPAPVPSELAGVVAGCTPLNALDDLVLSKPTRAHLSTIVEEWQHREALEQRGLFPDHRVLLSGPPGTGKTATAGAIALALDMPMFRVSCEALIGSLLGESSARVHKLFEWLATSPAVYLFDECDAIMSRRGSGQSADVENRRVVNTVLQRMECGGLDASMLVFATNDDAALDGAFARRFDTHVRYALPDRHEARVLFEYELRPFDDVGAGLFPLANEIEGVCSHAEIVRACRRAKKHAVINGTETIDACVLRTALGCQT